ncbi:PREDICTED: angio-associated migratory cell protein [Nicrophorus vespilloides]|uniref:Angio-associated migratory cell protein n=1 Tax=Nicrophorus vespilloides TaxID=110193 RepID=A0ABM1M011_NICVS|nr:PREDICTED: angio-associated migratory cell protein [Nicrophorus vespilloides]XP_017767913.1 PREDICTED: angio-associated migratory cell protein [Nicrophorus vespilloides]
MDEFDLPDDLKDVEVIYLQEGEEIEGMEDDDDFDVPDEIEEEEEEEADVIDLSKVSFSMHRNSVFSGELSSDGKLAITGGEDDMAYVWDTSTAELLFECTGHKDSVTHVGFNYNDELVVTGDMGGLIQVWSVKEKKLIWCYEGDDLEWLVWHQLTNIVIGGTQSGDVYVFKVPSGDCKVLPSHGYPSNCGKILPDGKKLAVGYGDGSVKLWDIKTCTTIWNCSEQDMSDVTALEINDDGSFLIACPSAKVIKIVDGKCLCTIVDKVEDEIETAVFNTQLGVVATGSLKGQLCVWDLGRQVMRHQARVECSVTVMKFRNDGKLLIGATDGAIYICDARSGLLSETLTGHKQGILSVCLCKDGKTILSTSDDGTAKIFNMKTD